MAKYVMFSAPGHGHVNPTLALAQELVTRGEQVIYYLAEFFRPAVEATGATFRSFGEETFWGPLASRQFPASGKKTDMGLLLSAQLYISLGTVFNDQPAFYNLCFEAFGQTGWQVILASGSLVDRSALKEIPANFSVASHVPQLQVLAQTDVFVSHGGMNSTMESLAFGVPLVIIPQMIEQEMTGRRVQELGLGLTLDMDSLTIDRLRTAVEQVRHDAAIRTNLQEMQREIRDSGGYRCAADAIVAYTQSVK